MLKYVAVLGVVFGMAFVVAREDQRAADQAAQKVAEFHKAAIATNPNEQHTEEHIDHPTGNSPRWYVLYLNNLFRWPNGTTVWAIILTLLAIAEQTSETRKSADAALLNAQALIKAERAWLTVNVGEIFQGELEFRYAKVPIKNTGGTPARVKRIVVTSMLIPFPKESWGRPGELPAEFTEGNSNHTMVVEGRDFVIPPGGEHMMYAMIFNAEWSTLTKKLGEGKQSWYVYGFAEYLDTIEGRETHKTGFCEIYWVADEPSKDVEGFRFTANLIPPAYICAT